MTSYYRQGFITQDLQVNIKQHDKMRSWQHCLLTGSYFRLTATQTMFAGISTAPIMLKLTKGLPWRTGTLNEMPK